MDRTRGVARPSGCRSARRAAAGADRAVIRPSRSSTRCSSVPASSTRRMGGGTIFSEAVLVVNQKAKLIEVNNEYAIFDQNGQQIGAVRQVGQSARKKVMRAVVEPRPVHDPQPSDRRRQRRRAARASRVRPRCSSRSSRSPTATGQVIGAIVQENMVGKIHFGLLVDGQRVRVRSTPRTGAAWNFNIQDARRRRGRAHHQDVGRVWPRRCSRPPTTTSCRSHRPLARSAAQPRGRVRRCRSTPRSSRTSAASTDDGRSLIRSSTRRCMRCAMRSPGLWPKTSRRSVICRPRCCPPTRRHEAEFVVRARRARRHRAAPPRPSARSTSASWSSGASTTARSSTPARSSAPSTGRCASILTAERTALNFLGHLVGRAPRVTRSSFVARRRRRRRIRVWDTRKTTPGLRALEKAAVARRRRPQPPRQPQRLGHAQGQPPHRLGITAGVRSGPRPLAGAHRPRRVRTPRPGRRGGRRRGRRAPARQHVARRGRALRRRWSTTRVSVRVARCSRCPAASPSRPSPSYARHGCRPDLVGIAHQLGAGARHRPRHPSDDRRRRARGTDAARDRRRQHPDRHRPLRRDDDASTQAQRRGRRPGRPLADRPPTPSAPPTSTPCCMRNFLDIVGYDMDDRRRPASRCARACRACSRTCARWSTRYFEFDRRWSSSPASRPACRSSTTTRRRSAPTASPTRWPPSTSTAARRSWSTSAPPPPSTSSRPTASTSAAPSPPASRSASTRCSAGPPRCGAVELVEPRNVIGKSTVESMQSGAVYGFAALRSTAWCAAVPTRARRAAPWSATGGLAALDRPDVRDHPARRAVAHPARPAPRLREERAVSTAVPEESDVRTSSRIATSPRTSSADVDRAFPRSSPAAETGVDVTVAGRLMLRREQGKLAFGTLQDATGRIQLFAPAAIDARLRRVHQAVARRLDRRHRRGHEDQAAASCP